MIALSEKLEKKLERVAQAVATDKPELHFFGLVHRENAADRWDLLVASESLSPWSIDSIKYIARSLKEVGKLTSDEMVTIGQIVALPPDNEVIQELRQNGNGASGKLKSVHPSNRFDQVGMVWAAEKSEHAA